MRKRQKIPARKVKRCFQYASPHICHTEEIRAMKERDRLAKQFKSSDFEVFLCPYCKRFHVGKVPKNDEDDC